MIREGETLFFPLLRDCCQTQKNRVSETSQIVQKPCFYAGNRTWTCTVSHQNLNLARLPIPPYPHSTSHQTYFYILSNTAEKVNHPRNDFIFGTNSVTVHAPTNSDTILCNEGVNSNPFAHKMLKCKHFGARFSLLLLTSEPMSFTQEARPVICVAKNW